MFYLREQLSSLYDAAMSLLMSLILYAGAAWATFPSGFTLEHCERLLDDDHRVPSVPAYRKLPVREKVRDVHAMIYLIHASMDQSSNEDMHRTAADLLATEALGTFADRLQILAKVSRSTRVPYAGELLQMSFELSGLAATAEEWDVDLNLALWAHFSTVADLPFDTDETTPRNLRAVNFLNLALIEGNLAKRATSQLKRKLLGSALNRLEHAAIEDRAGAGRAVAFGGLPAILEAVIETAPELSLNDRDAIDELATEILIAQLEPLTKGASLPSHFADVAESLRLLRKDTSAVELPQLRAALDEFKRQFRGVGRGQLLN